MKNKFLVLPFIAVMVLGIIFLSTMIPTVKMSPKDLPVAIVSEDAGEMGETLLQNLQKQLATTGMDMIKFKVYDSVQSMNEAMKEQEVYGGLVVPKNFSAQFASLQTSSPENPKMQIYINQGANASVSTMLTSALDNIVKQMNTVMSTQLLQNIEKAQVPIQVSQVTTLVTPIQAETIPVNAVGELGTAPTAFFQPLWFASIIGAVLLYFASKKTIFSSKQQKLKFHGLQSFIAIIYSFFAGYFVTWAATWMLGFSFENFNTVALFSSLACLGFLFLILATVNWLGLPSIAFYALLMFFGLPLIQMAPEMLPAFYQDYILPWLPMKFLINGLKDIFYFGQGVFNGNGVILTWIAVISFILLWVKQLIEKPSQPEEIEKEVIK
ncbi:SNG1 family protein [Sporosarcina aquimarina]|uniref:YhgE/Pip domain-containing protein n=1 Tax=Sporosarcina aquimarina TaxID=114975 RepID=UPI00203EE5C4|nr:ABC transporter permease [Sporosarcina aquimarina]MCM3756524.1 SNG1 family protein [Sporosarcina aquimarina]